MFTSLFIYFVVLSLSAIFSLLWIATTENKEKNKCVHNWTIIESIAIPSFFQCTNCRKTATAEEMNY